MEKNFDQKYVIGIQVRTENSTGRAEHEIPALWQRYFEDNIAAEITNKMSEELVVLYTDYEGDYTKPYTCVLGCEVNNLDEIPDGCNGHVVPAAHYKVFDVEGSIPEAVIDQWVKIWNSDLPRAYKTDMEIYPPDFDPAMNPKLQILIGLSV